jgi:Na+/melibiose symporter-like transporter
MKHVCLVQLGFAAVLLLISFIGLTPIDKPENFKGISAGGGDDVSVKDMLQFLKSNKPFQLYVVSAVSDKLAQNVGSQAIVSTLLFGILVGNVQLGTMLTVISMIPGIIFAIIGAKYAGKHGNKEATVKWTWACTVVAVLTAVFCMCIDMKQIGTNTILMVVFFLCLLAGNAAKMCVTTANGAMRADIVDYELDRSGKYLPAVVTATYNFIDQLVTSLGATIATFCVAALGYVNTAPQPGDPVTMGLKWMTMFLYFGLPILGWICTIIAMKGYHLDKAEMVNVQKRIADKKAELTK